MPLPKDVEDKIKELLSKEGINPPDESLLHSIALTNVPPDSFLTKVYVHRAENEATNLECSHKCWACGEEHNSAEDFIKHFGEHLVEFMSGTPPKLSEEQINERVKNLHPDHREEAKQVLRDANIKKHF